MKINKLNYENYVIDYIEGTLSIELKKDFDLFLEQNQDVYEEIKDYMSAPIYEETEEVFTNKKAVLQSNNIGKYALMALIPLLLIGAYFVMPSTTDTQTSTTAEKMEKEERWSREPRTENREERGDLEEGGNREARAESREERGDLEEGGNREPRTESREERGDLEEGGNREARAESREERRNLEPRTENRDAKIIEPSLNKENFDKENTSKPSLSEMRFAEVETTKETQKEKAVASRPILNTPVAIKNLDLSFDHNYQRTSKSTMVIAQMDTFNESEEKKEKKNIGWLEMITPAAFENIDVRESLAIQSNKNIDSRKILNAFKPETIVK